MKISIIASLIILLAACGGNNKSNNSKDEHNKEDQAADRASTDFVGTWKARNSCAEGPPDHFPEGSSYIQTEVTFTDRNQLTVARYKYLDPNCKEPAVLYTILEVHHSNPSDRVTGSGITAKVITSDLTIWHTVYSETGSTFSTIEREGKFEVLVFAENDVLYSNNIFSDGFSSEIDFDTPYDRVYEN